MKKAILYHSIVALSFAARKDMGLSVLFDNPILHQSYYPRNVIDQEVFERDKPQYKQMNDPFHKPYIDKGYNNFQGHTQHYGMKNKGNTRQSSQPQKNRNPTKPIRNLEKWARNQQKHPSLFR